MEVLDQVKGKVDATVNDVKENVADVQTKAEAQYGKLVDNYKTAVSSVKEEYAQQATALEGYKERVSSKFNKHVSNFNSKEIAADIKEEVSFFTNELKNSFERIKGSFAKEEKA